MLVRECDACEEAPLGGVCVPVVGMMAPAVHHSTQKGMAFIALEWCYQDLRESGRGEIQVREIAQGSLGGDFTCVCVCVFWPKGHMRLLNLCFSLF